jgi:hypothetical protein
MLRLVAGLWLVVRPWLLAGPEPVVGAAAAELLTSVVATVTSTPMTARPVSRRPMRNAQLIFFPLVTATAHALPR